MPKFLMPTQLSDVQTETVANEVIQYSEYEFNATDDFAGACAWIGGEYVTAENAKIPIFEAGFLHSDCTYTVAHVWHGNFFRLQEHIDRLFEHASRLQITPPMSKAEVAEIAHHAVKKSQLREAFVNMTITRGFGPRPGDRDVSVLQSQLYVFAIPYIWCWSPVDQIGGVDAVVVRHTRRTSAGSIDPGIKNFQWGDLVRANIEAEERGSKAAILLDGDNYLAEGPGYNILLVKDGRIVTPARNCLGGITRRTALDIADKLGVPNLLRDVESREIYEADEIFAATTAGGITPIVSIDGVAVGSGKPGPITTLIRTHYWRSMDEGGEWVDPVTY